MSYIKNTKDLILGIGSLLMSLWVIYDKTLIKGFTLGNMTFLARPDVYVYLIAGGWAILSILLILKSISLTGKKVEKVKFSFRLPRATILPMLAFIVYTLVLETVGFYISSILFMIFICFVYQLAEKNLTLKSNGVMKSFVISCVFSIIIVVVVGQSFTQFLKVSLP